MPADDLPQALPPLRPTPARWPDGPCPVHLVGQRVRVTHGKRTGQQGHVRRHLLLWMGERDNRYDPWNTHGFDVDLVGGKMVSLPWFAIEGLEE